MQIAKHFKVTSFDVELDVAVYPNDNKPTLLFLHGFPDCQKTWNYQVEGLKDNFEIITFNMRGVGGSTWSGRRDGYRIEHLLEDIDTVIKEVVGEQGQVHLIAHDWGSVIGWSFISDPYYGNRVLSYTSMSGPHLGLMLDWVKRNLLSGNRKRVVKALKQGVFSWYVYLFNLPFVPELLFRTAGKYIWKTALTTNGVLQNDPYLQQSQQDVEAICLNAVNLYRQNPLNPPPVPEKKSIEVPVNLIIPEEDNFISSQLFEYYDDYVVDLSKQVIEGKHWAHHSHYKVFNKMVKDFVNRIEQSQSSRVA